MLMILNLSEEAVLQNLKTSLAFVTSVGAWFSLCGQDWGGKGEKLHQHLADIVLVLRPGRLSSLETDFPLL